MSGKAAGDCCCCCKPRATRESFIGREVVWTGWHKRPPPRDPWDNRDKCALRCAIDPEKKKEPIPIKPRNFGMEVGGGACQEPYYPDDFDPSLALVKKRLNDGKDEVTETEQKFATTAVGIVGRRRETMLENRLLQRHQIGAPLRCCRSMPCEDFVYGHSIIHGWKASDALRGWTGTGLVVPAKQMVKKVPKRLCCTDILALNRAAIMAGTTSASEFRDYRNTHCLSFSRHARRGGERLPPIKADKDEIYGMKSNYVTSMKELMCEQELADWQACVKNCMRERMVVKKQSKPDPWRENTAYVMRASMGVKVPKVESLWKMPKFENKAKPHLCTYRTDTSLETAHKTNMLESVGRKGLFGEGITTRAVNKHDRIYPYKN